MTDAGIRMSPPVGRTVRLPFLIGCAFLAMICFPGLSGLPGGMTIAHALMFVGIPFWFSAAATRETLVLDDVSKIGVKIIAGCLIFLVPWAFLSALSSPDPLRSGRVVVTLISGFAIFFLIVGTVTQTRLYFYIQVLCLTLAATCVISFAAFYEPNLRSMIFEIPDRASGFFKNPNQFGMAISTLVPIATAGFVSQQRRRLIWAFCLVAFLLGLILSGSKTNLMLSSSTLAFVLFSYSIIAFSGVTRMSMMALSFLAICAIALVNYVLLVVFNPRALLLFQALISEDEELHSLEARNDLWQRSLDQFYSNPVLGQGAGHPLVLPHADSVVTHSHNVLLDYLRTLGAPGFTAFAIVIATAVFLSVSTLRLAFKAQFASNRDRILCVGLATAPLTYIAANFSSDSMGPSTSPFFWVVLFLSLTARLLLRVK